MFGGAAPIFSLETGNCLYCRLVLLFFLGIITCEYKAVFD